MKRKDVLWQGVAPALLLILVLGLVGCNGDGGGDKTPSLNTAPVLTVPTAQSVVQGNTLAFSVDGSDPDKADSLVYSVSGNPANASIDASTGDFTWIPTYDQIGVHNLTFTVSDGKKEKSDLVQVTVQKDASADPTAALAGGTLDPLTIPKYITPLVIPPVMNNNGTENNYEIAVRQFQQQILPGGIWNSINGRSDGFPATTVWSYGPAADPAPDSTELGGGHGIAPAPNSQFNYPAYTLETRADVPVRVRWINDLVDDQGNYLPHLLPVDQTVHWANPPQVCSDGSVGTDCMGVDPGYYEGPVPIVTHVHGAHVEGHSDGYPEAWWLPAGNNIPARYATSGQLFDDSTGANPGSLGYADYLYRNDQPATTLWYHDHTLGMTRLNVYAGPAGFWLIRGDHAPVAGEVVPDTADDQSTQIPNDGILPGPAPVVEDAVLDLNVPGEARRNAVREIPLVIQDRSFNADGSLFYPRKRAFFEGLDPDDLQINFSPATDVLPTWNPEAFFNVMVVNGVSWPRLEVAQARYRFRLLNGCNSRFLNLALFVVDPTTGRIDPDQEIPFYQIGADQGALPQVVRVTTGFATPLPGDGSFPASLASSDPDQALLMGLAERADVIVDFSGIPAGTVVRMVNTAPDAPFGGFDGLSGETDVADPATTGQVMQFVVNSTLSGASPTDPTGATPATAPENLVLSSESGLGDTDILRSISLNEEESTQVCVNAVFDADEGEFVPAIPVTQINGIDPENFHENCEAAGGLPFGPTAALLGTVDLTDPLNPAGIALKWTDRTGASTPVEVKMQDGSSVFIQVTENPQIVNGVAPTEEWDIYNFTADAHPIHLHLVRFEVVERRLFDGAPSPNGSTQPWESGFKDTVIAYPGEITRVRATFDLPGLYVWHCHIVEHEDNEMMRPYVVSEAP